MATPLTKNSLMLGNFVTGVAVLAPAGMLNELSAGLGVSIQQAGWLVTFGAIVMCFGSPLMAWATTHVDRRTLLTGTLAVIALGHIASAIAPNYAILLAARLALLVVAAVYTPQAASAVGLIVSEKERPGAIAYVFLGWSLAVAIGLPLVTFLAVQFGWQAAYAGIAAVAVVATGLNAIGLPRGLRGAPLSVASWIEIARNRQIVLLLLITVLGLVGHVSDIRLHRSLVLDLDGCRSADDRHHCCGHGRDRVGRQRDHDANGRKRSVRSACP